MFGTHVFLGMTGMSPDEFKAIEGKDNFYLAQKVFTFELSKPQAARRMKILRRVAVCDTRSDDHPCPKPE